MVEVIEQLHADYAARVRSLGAHPESLTPACIYARYSTKQQDKGSSIESQVSRAFDKAIEEKLYIGKSHIFFDCAESGTKDTRDGFQRMLECAKKKPTPFRVVICEDTSRFARNTLDAAVHKAELKKRGVKIVYLLQQFQDDIYGQLIEHIMEVIDEFWVKQQAEKTFNHMRTNTERKYSNGGSPPFGIRSERVHVG